jgi:hypothetical protein
MTFQIERWGAEDDSWNLETGGHPGIALVANAIGVWTSFQERPASVAEAARVFNIEASRVIEAVEFHAWMFLEGPTDDDTRRMIKLEGE